MASNFYIQSTAHGQDWVRFNVSFVKTSTTTGTYYMIAYCNWRTYQSSNFTMTGTGTKTLTFEFDDIPAGSSYSCYAELYGSTGNLIYNSGTTTISTDPATYYVCIAHRTSAPGNAEIASRDYYTFTDGQTINFSNYSKSISEYKYSFGLAGDSTQRQSWTICDNRDLQIYYDPLTYYTVTVNKRSDSISQTGITSFTPSSQQVLSGNMSNITVNLLNDNYRANGWYSASSGGTKLYNATTPLIVQVNGNLNLYCEAIKVRLTLIAYADGYTASTTIDGNSVTGVTVNNNSTHTLAATVPSNTSQYNYIWQGWYTGANGTGTLYNSNKTFTITVGSNNVNLYAYTKRLPTQWNWSSTIGGNLTTKKQSDGTYTCSPLTATEWNNFCSHINDVRSYKGLAYYIFTTVSAGNPMLASQASEARNAINAMSPPTAVPNDVSSGSIITANFINGITASLNSIS